MDLEHIRRHLALYKRGILTVPEFATSILIDLMQSDGPDAELPSFVATFPEPVRNGLIDLLREIQKADHHWTPFRFGPSGSVLKTEADDSARLRQLCNALHLD